MHTSNKLNVKTINFHADSITWKFKSKTMLWPKQHINTDHFSLHCYWIRVVSAKGLWHDGTSLLHTLACNCKLQHALRNPWISTIIACVGIFLPGTIIWGQTRMNLYRLVQFKSTEFITCTRETMTLLYETENKWTRIGEYNKVWHCFRHHISSLLLF